MSDKTDGEARKAYDDAIEVRCKSAKFVPFGRFSRFWKQPNTEVSECNRLEIEILCHCTDFFPQVFIFPISCYICTQVSTSHFE